jgi:hypothetical protein
MESWQKIVDFDYDFGLYGWELAESESRGGWK